MSKATGHADITDSRQEIRRGAGAILAIPEIDGDRRTIGFARSEEATGLAHAIGLNVVECLTYRVREPKPATLFGAGQVDLIGDAMRKTEAELLVVDSQLSAIQQRNLEDTLSVKVIDRTGLILEIFGERAATAEGRLQVELAHLDYQAGRLVRSWTHLERQRGGFGFLGGPGETQIEADRRMIRDRMAKIRRELEQVKKTRALHRDRRSRAPWPVIALVGYTNAGKSTLFNRLTGAEVIAKDLLFATLDPTMRAVELGGIDKAILSDTVGFVSDLPTQLVAAFRATLEEVLSADLIVHVRDISHESTRQQKADVETILVELGINTGEEDEADGHIPIIEAWNKWDLLETEERDVLATIVQSDNFPISAWTGEGVDTLVNAVAEILTATNRLHHLVLAQEDGARLAWLHQHGKIVDESVAAGERHLDVRLSEKEWGRFQTL